MRFLVDESCDVALGKALVEAGNDVREIRVIRPGADDEWVVNLAVSENRILLTEDKDFGWLVYASHTKSAGVVLLRFPGDARQTLVQAVRRLVQEQGRRLIGAFVVVQPGHARISHKPGAADREGD